MHRFSFSLAAIAVVAAVTVVPACAQTGDNSQAAGLFKENCASCHGEDGTGTPLGRKMNAANLRSKAIQQKPAAELAQTIAKGKNKMPAFSDQITSDQINSLVEYVRSLRPSPAK